MACTFVNVNAAAECSENYSGVGNHLYLFQLDEATRAAVEYDNTAARIKSASLYASAQAKRVTWRKLINGLAVRLTSGKTFRLAETDVPAGTNSAYQAYDAYKMLCLKSDDGNCLGDIAYPSDIDADANTLTLGSYFGDDNGGHNVASQADGEIAAVTYNGKAVTTNKTLPLSFDYHDASTALNLTLTFEQPTAADTVLPVYEVISKPKTGHVDGTSNADGGGFSNVYEGRVANNMDKMSFLLRAMNNSSNWGALVSSGKTGEYYILFDPNFDIELSVASATGDAPDSDHGHTLTITCSPMKYPLCKWLGTIAVISD